jgi:hypothetical protein
MAESASDAGGSRPADIDENELAHHRRLIIRSGEQVLYAGVHVTSKVKPLITTGHFKNGEPAVHFRNYRPTGADGWVITKEGASFTLPEIATAIRRLCALFPYVPELLVAMRLMEGRSDDAS